MKKIIILTSSVLLFLNISFAQYGSYNSLVKHPFDRFMFNSEWGLTLNAKQNIDPFHTYAGIGYFFLYKYSQVSVIFETSMNYGFQSKYFLNDISGKLCFRRLILPLSIGLDYNIYHDFSKSTQFLSPIIAYDIEWLCLYYGYSFRQNNNLLLDYTHHAGLILRPQIVYNILMTNYNQWGHHLYKRYERKSRKAAAKSCKGKPADPKIKPVETKE